MPGYVTEYSSLHHYLNMRVGSASYLMTVTCKFPFLHFMIPPYRISSSSSYYYFDPQGNCPLSLFGRQFSQHPSFGNRDLAGCSSSMTDHIKRSKSMGCWMLKGISSSGAAPQTRLKEGLTPSEPRQTNLTSQKWRPLSVLHL